jgi:hypothetical protein
MGRKRVDFDDEDAVLKEMAKALDVEWNDLAIREARNYEDFGTGTVYEITQAFSNSEWYVVENDDQAEALAIEIVEQDLNDQPEIFNQDFIEQHIDTDRLRRDLMRDVVNMRIEDLTDEAERRPDDFWQTYEGEGLDAPEENEDGERREPKSSEIEELAERLAEGQLEDPIEYLEDIYGKEDAVKKAIEIAGIDVEAAAKEAVNADGPGHFLSSYDSNIHETPNGLVYWRHN